MVREELINSAVAFLRDPSIATSTLEQRVSFLKSKNLTQEEIDVSIARAGGDTVGLSGGVSVGTGGYNGLATQQFELQQRPGYGPYQGSPWGVYSGPLRRDWRDWFIMATITSGVGYGLYLAMKRWFLPLVAPPTTSQLDADKASIDESFSRAFALIDQLATDTQELKESEKERAKKIDSALEDVNSVCLHLKETNESRKYETRQLRDQVERLQDLIPSTLNEWKAAGDGRIDELGAELRGLRKLLGARVGSSTEANPVPSLSPLKAYPHSSAQSSAPRSSSSQPMANKGSSVPTGGMSPTPGPSFNIPPSTLAHGITLPKPDATEDGYKVSRPVSIPAWQLAASNGKNTSGPSETPNTSEERAEDLDTRQK